MPSDYPPVISPDNPGKLVEQVKAVKKILIVDDLFENRYLLEILLKGNGYLVLSAKNGQEALKILKTESVDVIISDILMPVMDGFKLCRTVKEDPKYAHLPFIFNTASYTETKDRHFGLSLGADEYIIKPIDPQDLIAIIKRVLSRSEADEMVFEKSQPPDKLSFYTSYSYIIEHKLNEKITELDHHKQALHTSEVKFQSFLENLQGFAYLVQVGEDRPLVFEGLVEEITGYPVQEFQSGTLQWKDIIHPGDKEKFLIEREPLESKHGTRISMQYRINNKNGEIRWVHEIASNFHGTKPDIFMIQGSIFDITLQKTVDEQNRISEEYR